MLKSRRLMGAVYFDIPVYSNSGFLAKVTLFILTSLNFLLTNFSLTLLNLIQKAISIKI